jgi:hypothetical protein
LTAHGETLPSPTTALNGSFRNPDIPARHPKGELLTLIGHSIQIISDLQVIGNVLHANMRESNVEGVAAEVHEP